MSPLKDTTLKIAFTWAPCPGLQNTCPDKSYKLQLPFITKLKLCANEITISPEMFLNGGMHWHGQMVIHDQVKWYKSVLPMFKKYGHVKIKVNPNAGWHEYVLKTVEIMRQVLDVNLPLDKSMLQTRQRRDVKMPYSIMKLDDYLPSYYSLDGLPDKKVLSTPDSYECLDDLHP